ncbi:hypothetical protein [uncultured Desulfobulbus sp.]|uniref:hypothetical protein n=1 Tax=uncultured Desulfobulbus sp. TaxID=239745 RepID=UPI0029C63021|nr:hypothetical protein [uncultured Desulfobulbus sp.]
MTTQDNQRVYLDDLGKRWQKSADQILEMAISGTVALWIEFPNVFLQKMGKVSGGKKKKTPAPQLQVQAVVKPQAEVLTMIQGRCDRMLIGAEFPCLDADNKAVMVTNSVGEEWGETSMIGLKPNTLFARLDEVIQFERKHGIGPETAGLLEQGQQAPLQQKKTPANPKDHPCFALELHVAENCWNAHFSQAEAENPGIKKADILAWLRQQHPELSKAATERIALVVTPTKDSSR